MLQIKDLRSGYGKHEILRGVTIHAKPRQIVALIGPNGAGKSTVLKSVFSIADVFSGRIFFREEDITCLKTHELLQKGIGYVPQGRINFSDLSVLENLEIGSLGSNKSEVQKKLRTVYDKFPVLREKQKELAFSLSGGQQQMLALGRVLMQSPSLILLDEPSLGLSPKLQKELFRTLEHLRDEEGMSLLIVEQNAKKAVEMADHTFLLENGKVALSGGKDVIRNEKIRKIYLGGTY